MAERRKLLYKEKMKKRCLCCGKKFTSVEAHRRLNKYCNDSYYILDGFKTEDKNNYLTSERKEVKSRCMSCKNLYQNVEEHTTWNKHCKRYYNLLMSSKLAKCKILTVDLIKIKLKKSILDELRVERKKREREQNNSYWRGKNLQRTERCTSESHKKVNDLLFESLNLEDNTPLCGICYKPYTFNSGLSETPLTSDSHTFVPAHQIFGNPMVQVKQEIVERTSLLERTSNIERTPIIEQTPVIEVKQEIFDSSYENENEEDYARNPLALVKVKVEEMNYDEENSADDNAEESVDVRLNASATSDNLIIHSCISIKHESISEV